MATYSASIPAPGRVKPIRSKLLGCHDGPLILFAMSCGFQAFRHRLHTVSAKHHPLQLQIVTSSQASTSIIAKPTHLARRFSWGWQLNAECSMNAQCSGSLVVGHGSSETLNGMASDCKGALKPADPRTTHQDTAAEEYPLKRGLEDESAGPREAASTGHE